MHCKSLWRKDSIDADLFSSFECFPELDKEYKVRLGLTIVAAVLTHSSGILVGAIMMRFGNEKESEEERDPIEQDRGSSHRGFDDTSGVQLNSSSEAQFKNEASAKRTVSIEMHSFQWYATHQFYLFKQRADANQIRCICAHNATITILRLRKQIAQIAQW